MGIIIIEPASEYTYKNILTYNFWVWDPGIYFIAAPLILRHTQT